MRAILSFSSPRCAIIARLNVIYTKFGRAMIAQLNKIRRACGRVRVRLHATHGQACSLESFNQMILGSAKNHWLLIRKADLLT